MDILRLDDVSEDRELGARRSRFGDCSLFLSFSLLAVADAFLLDGLSLFLSARGLSLPLSLSFSLLAFRLLLSSSISRREVTLVPDKLNMASAGAHQRCDMCRPGYELLVENRR
jgi:hypothetical protein